MTKCNLCNAEISRDEIIECSIIFEGHSEYGAVQEYGPLIVSYCINCNQQGNLTQKLSDAFQYLAELIQFERKKSCPVVCRKAFKCGPVLTAGFEI